MPRRISLPTVSESAPNLTIVEAAVALTLPIAIVTLVESFILAVVARWMPGSRVALFVLGHGHWLLALALAVGCMPACRRGGQGALAIAAGMAIALFCIFRFRGSHEWEGTFSLYDRNPHYWEFAAVLGATMAALGGLAMSRFSQPKHTWTLVAAATVVLATLVSWFDACTYSSMSLFAPTRHLAMLVVALGVLGCFGFEILRERYSDEKKSIYDH